MTDAAVTVERAATRALLAQVAQAGPETAGLLTLATLAEEQAARVVTVPMALMVTTAPLLAKRVPTEATVETLVMVV